MKTPKIRDVVKAFQVTDGRKFRLKNYDPDDTLGRRYQGSLARSCSR